MIQVWISAYCSWILMFCTRQVRYSNLCLATGSYIMPRAERCERISLCLLLAALVKCRPDALLRRACKYIACRVWLFTTLHATAAGPFTAAKPAWKLKTHLIELQAHGMIPCGLQFFNISWQNSGGNRQHFCSPALRMWSIIRPKCLHRDRCYHAFITRC